MLDEFFSKSYFDENGKRACNFASKTPQLYEFYYKKQRNKLLAENPGLTDKVVEDIVD